MGSVVKYHYKGFDNPYLGRCEATSAKLTKLQLARLAYDDLRKSAFLPKDMSFQEFYSDFSACLEDTDADGRIEIDCLKLVTMWSERGVWGRKLDKETRDLFANEIVIELSDCRGIKAFIPAKDKGPQPGAKSDDGDAPPTINSALSAFDPLYDLDVNYEPVAAAPGESFWAPLLRVPHKHNLATPIGYIQQVYDTGSVYRVNVTLQMYLREHFVHNQSFKISDSGRPYWTVSPGGTDITPETNVEGDFANTDVDGKPKSVVDCDIYALIGYTILSNIHTRDGKPAFKIEFVDMFNADSGHAVLIFTEIATGKTFILSNDTITEVPPGQTYVQAMEARFPNEYTTFKKFSNLEDYSARNRSDAAVIHKVNGGENLWEIVKKEYGVTDERTVNAIVLQIIKANGMRPGETLRSGRRIILPEVEVQGKKYSPAGL